MTASRRPRSPARFHLRAGLIAVMACASIAGCDCNDSSSARVEPSYEPERALAACDGGNPYECEWGRLLKGRGDLASLGRLLDGQPKDMDALLRRFFPEIGDKPISDRPMSVPSGLVFDHKSFDPYTIPVPVDWRADPFSNNSWRLYFQSLQSYFKFPPGQAGVEAGAALLADWVDQVLHASPPLEWTWGDHAMSMRLDRAARLSERYIASSPVLDRGYLHAAARLIATHLYALASDCRYRTAHNHSMMHDLAVLRWVRRFPALRDGERMRELTGRRMMERQVRQSVTEDGVHIENSGCYHLFYVDLVNNAIGELAQDGQKPPEDLVRLRDSMLEPLVHHLQPDLSFAQFGDCPDVVQSSRLKKLLTRIRELGVGDPSALAPLEWVVSGGKRGAAPPVTRVYEKGGYAFFRDRWDGPADAITAGHFKTGHQSGVHYHADDTGFEVFAHGHELIVGPGVYTYVAEDPFRDYQRSPSAHNVLVVDDSSKVSAKPDPRTRVLAHGSEADVAWVQGTHASYEVLGVTSLVRTFAFARPDTFVVVDHVAAEDRHDYAQHFHLHPDVSQVRVADDRTVVAGVEGGPSLTITAAVRPDAIETARGVAEGAVRKGWHFPDIQTRLPAHDVVLRVKAGDVDLPVLIVVSPPGQTARVPRDIAYREEKGAATVTWRVDGVERSLRVPAR